MRDAFAIFGPPGIGTSTQARALKHTARTYGLRVEHVSSGDLIREVPKGSSLYAAVAESQATGCRVTDQTMIKLLQRCLEGMPARYIPLLDGVPCNAAQADLLEDVAQIILAVALESSDDRVLEQRLARRAQHDPARTYDRSSARRRERIDSYRSTEEILSRYHVSRIEGTGTLHEPRSKNAVFMDVHEAFSRFASGYASRPRR